MRNCAPGRWPACALACSMAAWTPMKKRSSCAVSSAAKSMCWLRPPSSKSASMCPTRPSWLSNMPSASASPRCTSLRGRVGRGAAKSYCILMTGQKVSPLGEERLNAMVRTQTDSSLQSWTCRSAVPASSSALGKRGCPTSAWPPGARPAVAGTGQAGSRSLCQPPSLDQAGSSEQLSPSVRVSGPGSRTRGSGGMAWWSRLSFHFSRFVHRGPTHPLHGKCLDLQIDAGNFRAALSLVAACALAQLCDANMPALLSSRPAAIITL